MAAPAPLVLVSVAAVAVAGIAFVATQGGDEEPDKAAPVSQSVEEPTETATAEKPAKKQKPKKKPVNRGKIYVEVYNNSNIAGLAGSTAQKATDAGWQVVGSDNRDAAKASTIEPRPSGSRPAPYGSLDPDSFAARRRRRPSIVRSAGSPNTDRNRR